jgi:hypothetical protein
MDASTLIDRLGGTSKVAVGLGVTPPAVSMWRTAGIPASRWVRLTEIAASSGIGLTLDMLAASSPATTHPDAHPRAGPQEAA